MNTSKRRGRGNTFKTGQRVPRAGTYVDQHGVPTWHDAHATFPPCVGRKGECAYRLPIAEWQLLQGRAAH